MKDDKKAQKKESDDITSPLDVTKDQTKLFDSINRPYAEHAKLFDIITRPFADQAKLFDSITRPYAEHAKLFDSITRPFADQAKLFDSITRPYAEHAKLFDSITRPFADQTKLFDSITRPYAEHAKLFDSITRPFVDQAKLFDSITAPYAENAKLLESIRRSLNPSKSLTNAHKEKSISQAFLEAAKELNENTLKDSDAQYSAAINDLMDELPEILKSESQSNINVYLSQVPEKVRWVLYFFFWSVVYAYFKAVFIDTAVGLTSDNLKPMIRAYICEKDWATNKIISALICGAPEGRFKSNRFVKVDHLYVRKTPNAKGEIIDLLPRFEPVTLIEKSENLSWSLIRYKNDDSELMEGWVFSRYLYKPDH